uniref:Uncharacterized protein n=1 Tax=Arundo donax TaxID=35708 RepID=A0A0A9GYL9_ARUDO
MNKLENNYSFTPISWTWKYFEDISY